MGPKEDCCICPIPFSWFWAPCSAMCLLKLWFFMNHLSWRLPTSAIGFSMPWTLNMQHSSNFDAFFPVQINKMWNFCLKLWFFRNCLLQGLETCGIGFGMPWTLNMQHSSHFDAFSQSKSTKCEILAVSLTLPPHKNLKNCQFAQGKGVCKGLQICTYRFLCMPIAMYYVRTLCDK